MKSCFLLPILLLIAHGLRSQTDTITTRVITFDGDFATETPVQSKTKYFRNVIKVNPLLFIQGDIPIYYERAINSKFSLELGLGMTRRDYQYGLFNEQADGDINSERIETKNGPSFKLGFRFYPEGYAPEDLYLAFEYSYRKYNLQYLDFDQNYEPTIEVFDTERIFNEIKAILGNQKEFYYTEGLFWEYYLGLGLRFVDEVLVTEEFDPNVTPSSFLRGEASSDVRPAFYWGLKLGVAF